MTRGSTYRAVQFWGSTSDSLTYGSIYSLETKYYFIVHCISLSFPRTAPISHNHLVAVALAWSANSTDSAYISVTCA